MVAFASALFSIGVSMIADRMSKSSDPTGRAAGEAMLKYNELTNKLIDSDFLKQKMAEPGEAEIPEWQEVLGRQIAGWERSVRRNNPNLPEGVKVALAKLEKDSAAQRLARLEDERFEVEA